MEKIFNPRPTNGLLLLNTTILIHQLTGIGFCSLICIDTNDEDKNLKQGDLELHKLYTQKCKVYIQLHKMHVVLNQIPNKIYDSNRFVPTYISLN